jgi:SAM-dependent methyltransferase
MKLCKACLSPELNPVNLLDTTCLLECVDCGLISDHLRYTNDELKRLYADIYNLTSVTRTYDEHEKDFKNKLENPDYTIRLGWHRKRALSIINNDNNKDISIFEFGAGIGAMYSHLKEFDYSSIEFDASTVKKNLILNPKNNVIEGDICNHQFNEKFNYIIAFEVLEHVSDLQKALSNIKNGLKPKGLFIFSVPNFYKYDRLKNNKLHQEPPPVHLNFFHIGNERFFNQMGFKVESIQCKPYPALRGLKRHFIPFLSGNFTQKGSTLLFALSLSE